MKEKLSIATVKFLAIGIASLIIYISVTGFISLIGGTAGIIIGGIFGMAELAFIIFFPSTLVKWKFMSTLGKVSITAIVISLSVLSFASTNTYITKHMSVITVKADENENNVKIKQKTILEKKENIHQYETNRERLSEELSTLNIALSNAETTLQGASAEVNRITFSRGDCSKSKDCTSRQDIAKGVVSNAQQTVDGIRYDIQSKKKELSNLSERVYETEKAIDSLNANISRINKNKVEDDNAKKLYEGYILVGSKINQTFNITDTDPIQTFTMAIAVILYALYILLTIWMNTLLHISEDHVKNYRSSKRRKNVFIRIIKFLKSYKNSSLERELENAMNASNSFKNQLITKAAELASVSELLTISKEREAILLRAAQPVTETVYVAVPEKMTPSEAKRNSIDINAGDRNG